MINIDDLRRVLDLHAKAFSLLRWVGRQMRAGTLDVSVVHGSMGFAEAAEEWIKRNQANLPADVRACPGDLPAFARLFASFLRTSFEPAKNVRGSSECGCYCDYCSYLTNAPYLKPRKLSKKAYQTATELKRLYLQELAKDVRTNADAATLQRVTSEEGPLARNLAIATYAKELMRRAEFVTQGEGVYALWREIAWVDGHPDPKFTLTAESVQRAQDSVIGGLKAQST